MVLIVIMLQPFGQVPAFEDESISIFDKFIRAISSFSFILFSGSLCLQLHIINLNLCVGNTESQVICCYLCDKYADKGDKGLYGTNPLAKASIDQWIEVEGQSFNPPSSTLVLLENYLKFQLWFKKSIRFPS